MGLACLSRHARWLQAAMATHESTVPSGVQQVEATTKGVRVRASVIFQMDGPATARSGYLFAYRCEATWLRVATHQLPAVSHGGSIRWLHPNTACGNAQHPDGAAVG